MRAKICQKAKKEDNKITAEQIDEIKTLVSDISAMLNYYKKSKIEDLTKLEAQQIIDKKKGVK